MTANHWLKEVTEKLRKTDIPTARLDALVLLEDVTGKDRAWLLAHPEHALTNDQLVVINAQIERRTKHEPLAYIRGKSEFYGRDFIVTKHTLEPRPETEAMIELLKSTDLSKISKLVDVGTGSGAIAITTKLELPGVEVYATDLDNKCIQAAKDNAKKHNMSIDFRQGNLLNPVLDKILDDWLILANLPYVPDNHAINKAAKFEPKHAIFGGNDGLDLYREMFLQIDSLQTKPIYVFTESLPFQHEELASISSKSGYELLKQDDFIQVFKLLT